MLIACAPEASRSKRPHTSPRRWRKNSAMAIHVALPIRYFDELGVPRLAV